MEQQTKKSRIGFYGGVGAVTGANFMLETPQKRFLVDCGLLQGRRICEDANCASFAYDPSSIDTLFVTHSHIDHIGRIPKLVKDGFRGQILSTPETRDLARIMLPDAAHIMEEEAAQTGTTPIYTGEDIAPAFEHWDVVSYHTPKIIGDVEVTFKDAGHILGSSMIEFQHEGFGKLLFTGDLGNSPSSLLPDTEHITDANYMVIESVYGDRIHEPAGDRLARLEDLIEDIVVRKGTLLIPAFSVERTQMILYDINTLVENDRVPKIPVFLDAPLAIKVTEVYKRSVERFNEKTQALVRAGDDIFSFSGLQIVRDAQESRAIQETPGPKIIVAGSGMSHGGRIVSHERRYLSDSASTLLIVGYQTPGSLGRQIQDGAREVTIGNQQVPIRARIETLHGYSGHRDLDGLLEFVSYTNLTLKKLFVTMGEPKASQFFVQRLRDYLGVDAVNPELGSVIEIG